MLEQAAGPAGTEHAARDQPVEHGGGSADGGDAQVGAVGLGVGADVHDPVGQERPEADVAGGRDLARVVVLDDEGVVPADDGGELAGAGGRHAHAGRVVGARLQDDDARPGVERPVERVGSHAVPVERDGDAFEPELVEQVEQGWEAGVLDRDARAVAGDAFEGAADGVEGAVDDGDALRRERPRVAQEHLEGGHDGGGDVGAGVGGGPLERDPGQGGTDQGQQLGVRGAGRQVEAGGRSAGEVAVAGREPAGGRRQDDGPGAAAGDHDADGRERLPGAADGRGADAEVGGEGADGREAVAGPQVTAADEARHGRRDAARAAVVDVGGEVHAGQDARREPGPRRPPGDGSDVYVGGADVRVRVPVSNSAEMFNPDSHIPGYGAKNGHSGAA